MNQAGDSVIDALRKISEAAIEHDEALLKRIKDERDLALLALKWALQGHYAVSWESGFVKARDCAESVEPPAEGSVLI
jgi:hypothetical protein